MQGRWIIPFAALALALTPAVAATAASAAAAPSAHSNGAAAAASVRPGGVAHLVRPGSALARPGAIRAATATSTNWSGYAVTSGTYSKVSSSWTQPAGTCTSSGQYAAFWVGLDGFNSTTVEQDGTQIACSGRTATYNAWYEMYPANPVYFSNTVSPGDHFTASVTYVGSNEYSLSIADTTKGWSHTVTASLAGAARSSAEAIVEAPCCTGSGGILPLADFGTASFTGSTANGTAIGSQSPTEITMIDNSGRDKDSISSLSGNENWTATWIRSN